jgi:hypothetical protein
MHGLFFNEREREREREHHHLVHACIHVHPSPLKFENPARLFNNGTLDLSF